MKVFLTGATGKVGSRFATYLLNQGIEVRALIRDLDRGKGLQEQGAELVLGDLSDKEKLVAAISGTDVVVHLAAQFRGVTEEVAWKSNVVGTQCLAEATLKAGIKRFVFSSTSLIYMDVPRLAPCVETDALNPKALYPKTKKVAEDTLIQLKEVKGLDVRILRFAFVYGDGDEHLAEFMPIMRTWNPEQKMSMIHHADICQALYLASITENVSTGIYNVSDCFPSSVSELLNIVGVSSAFSKNSPEINPFGMILSTDAIENELGFEAQYPSYKVANIKKAL